MIDSEDAQVPVKRTQFPLWFLLFVLPTIAGLGFAIYANWEEQSQLRASLIADHAVLQDRIAKLQREGIKLEVLNRRLHGRWVRWQTADAVMGYLKGPKNWEKPGESHFTPWPIGTEANCFFLQASEKELRRLLTLMREQYPAATPQVRYTMLTLTRQLPEYVPKHAQALSEEVRKLVEVASEEDQPLVKQEVARVRQAFGLRSTSAGKEGSS